MHGWPGWRDVGRAPRVPARLRMGPEALCQGHLPRPQPPHANSTVAPLVENAFPRGHTHTFPEWEGIEKERMIGMEAQP